MLFEKAIRRRQSHLPQNGHLELDSQATSGLPIFDLQPLTITPAFLDEELDWPQRVELIAKWQAVPVNADGVSVQEIVSGVAVTPSSFYSANTADAPELAKASAYAGIQLIYIKQDLPDAFNLSLGQGDVFYEKHYQQQSPGQLTQVREAIADGRWRITAPKTGAVGDNLVPLLSYGCYGPPAGHFNHIEQVYASIGTNGKQTSVKLYKESYLRQQGVVLPQGGTVQGWQYHFVDASANTSLMSDILNHQIRIQITSRDVVRNYVSVAHGEYSPIDQLIYLTFRPE